MKKKEKQTKKKISFQDLFREVMSYDKFNPDVWDKKSPARGDFSILSYSGDCFFEPGRDENLLIIEADIEKELISIDKTISKNIEFYLSSTVNEDDE